MINNKIGCAVIGYGGMGNWHTRKIKNEMGEYAELIGIYDINPQRCLKAEENGIHAYSSREELLSDERIDLVTIATPNDVHKEIAIDAMRHGKNVISEKPVTLCSADLEEMIACAEEFEMPARFSIPCVFFTGMIFHKGDLLVSYGAADERVGLLKIDFKKLMEKMDQL